jgi:hypothetical protein
MALQTNTEHWCAMNFGLTPKEYLAMVIDTWEEFKVNPLSKRHLIALCIFANHLPEIIIAEYGHSVPGKVQNYVTGATYRAYAVSLCPEIGIVRDLCDFGKHGPFLDRKSVEVKETDVKERLVGDAVGIAFVGFPIARKIDKLVVTLNDGKEMNAEAVVSTVVEFWKMKFASDNL